MVESHDLSREKIAVCFVGLYAYSLFNPDSDYLFGGSEIRSHLISKTLSQSPDYDITYVVHYYGQRRRETFGNITVYAHTGFTDVGFQGPQFIARLLQDIGDSGGVFRHTTRFPYRRIKNWDPTLLIKAAVVALFTMPMFVSRTLSDWWQRPRQLHIRDYVIPYRRVKTYSRIDADIYCVLGVANLSGEIAAYCKDADKRFVLFIGSDKNLNADYQPTSTERNHYGDLHHVCHYAIANADLIFTQHETQNRLLKDRFDKCGIVVRNPIDLTTRVHSPGDSVEGRFALWVGRADDFVKMPMILIRLAKACPDTPFLMVMNPHIRQVEEQVYREKPANVTIVRSVPYTEIERLFSQAFVLVNTSLFEGFPNTFLQAGKYGVPILSYQVDPDDFIQRYDCGIVAQSDFDKLVDGMRTIQENRLNGNDQYSRNIRKYVEENHDLEEQTGIIDRALRELIAENNPE